MVVAPVLLLGAISCSASTAATGTQGAQGNDQSFADLVIPSVPEAVQVGVCNTSQMETCRSDTNCDAAFARLVAKASRLSSDLAALGPPPSDYPIQNSAGVTYQFKTLVRNTIDTGAEVGRMSARGGIASLSTHDHAYLTMYTGYIESWAVTPLMTQDQIITGKK